MAIAAPFAVFAAINAAFAIQPQSSSVWRPNGCFDCISWTGLPQRFIGFGGIASHWEIDGVALRGSLFVVALALLLSGIAIAVIQRRCRRAAST